MKSSDPGWKNKLYFGDNLDILREHVADESVDLIYLDPLFNSQATYNVLFGEKDGSRSQAQITAFEDTWEWGKEAETTYNDVLLERPGRLADFLQALRGVLRNSNMMAYLTMMTSRLLELHRVLKPAGSICLHCDQTASHYLKLLMDTIFGPENFRIVTIAELLSGTQIQYPRMLVTTFKKAERKYKEQGPKQEELL
jgi:site-specific DNA-methyltransferase (adenine-specific)